ncbi:glycoside hydrolase family 3 N-terminal domain-containing protein [Luteococcus peritonei]|uniref:Glycoside hydrolase family 3 N-terminal domain-containing protein n=1 Tax=Luteococcus peritonei TaxID=88874 RepID=A0ABW4RXB1_9ACTN
MERLALGVLMPGFEGSRVPHWLRGPLADGLAAVCLFAPNVADRAAATALCCELRELSPGVVIGIDEEGGDVTRLHAATGSPLPGLGALGAVDDEEAARRAGRLLGADLAGCGITLDLTPVLDVASEPANPVIGSRSFGASPDQVARLGAALVSGLHEHGVAACGKHFPGHGDTTVDSHVGLPVIDAPRQVVLERDVAPFAALAGVLDAVMTGHLLVPALGEGPASLSSWCYALLRETGFEGVALTDALGMRAVSGADIGPAVVQALAAGADLCCLDAPMQRDGRTTFEQARRAVEAALADGFLDPAALEASGERNRALGRELVPVASQDEQVLQREGLELARRAVSARGDVRVGPRVAFLDLRARLNHAAGEQPPTLAEELARVREVEPLQAGESLGELPLVLQVREPLLAPEGELLAQLLRARPDAVVVHCGQADAAPAVDRLVLAHDAGRAMARTAVELLCGRGGDDGRG